MNETSDIAKSLRKLADDLRRELMLDISAKRNLWARTLETAANRLGGESRWGAISNPELEFLGFALEYWQRRYRPTRTKRALIESLAREITRRGLRTHNFAAGRNDYPWVGLDREDLELIKNWAESYPHRLADDPLYRSLQEELDYWREER